MMCDTKPITDDKIYFTFIGVIIGVFIWSIVMSCGIIDTKDLANIGTFLMPVVIFIGGAIGFDTWKRKERYRDLLKNKNALCEFLLLCKMKIGSYLETLDIIIEIDPYTHAIVGQVVYNLNIRCERNNALQSIHKTAMSKINDIPRHNVMCQLHFSKHQEDLSELNTLFKEINCTAHLSFTLSNRDNLKSKEQFSKYMSKLNDFEKIIDNMVKNIKDVV